MRRMNLLEKLHFMAVGPKLARDFQQVQLLSPTDLAALQNDRFMRIFKHACETVPFYQKKYKAAGVRVDLIRSIADIKELPVVEKSELIDAYPHDTISTLYKDRSDLFTFVTGGTSGATLRVAHCRQSIFATLASYHRALNDITRSGFNRRSVSAYVYTSPYPFNSFFGAYRHHFIWTLDPIGVILRKLKDVQPHLLTAYPSTIDKITLESSAGDKELIGKRLRAIALNSEMSSQTQRDAWSASWNVPVLDEFSSEEISTVMFHQCPDHSYHAHIDTSVLESVDDDGRTLAAGEEGNLVVTGLCNFAMPLIRYNQQDRLTLEDPAKRCSCGMNFPLVKSFLGRKNDAFRLPSGRILSSGYLLDVGYSTLVKFADHLKFWALVQESPSQIFLECAYADSAPNNLTELIEFDLAKMFYGEALVKVRQVKEPLLSKNGKRRQIVSRVKELFDDQLAA